MQGSVATWKMGITACGQALGEVEFKRGIFQGDSLSRMKFVICMVPLSSMLRKIETGHINDNVKMKNLLFMDHLRMRRNWQQYK